MKNCQHRISAKARTNNFAHSATTPTPKNVAPAASTVSTNTVVKQGKHKFNEDGVSATIEFGEFQGKFIAEFRFILGHGLGQACTLPLTANSVPHASVEAAAFDAAARLVAALEQHLDGVKLSAKQKKSVSALIAWAESFKAPVAQATPAVPETFKVKTLEVFGGVGAFTAGVKPLGATCVGYIELDPEARKTFIANNPGNYVVHDDVRTVKPGMFGEVDLICGGFPCQSVSLAGNQMGFKDPKRGPLFFHLLNLINEYKPAMCILENVVGLCSNDDGKTFETVVDSLTDAGYSVSTKIVNSAKNGVAQSRERVFIVGIHDRALKNRTTPFIFPADTDDSVVVEDILEATPGIAACKGVMERVKPDPLAPIKGIKTVGRIDGKTSQGYRVASVKGKGYTLCSESGGAGPQSGLYLVDGKPRTLSARECARMQGFPDSFKVHPNLYHARHQFGNSIAVPVVAAIAKQLSQSIR